MGSRFTRLRAAVSVSVVSGLLAVSACSATSLPVAESPALIDTPMPADAVAPLEDAVRHAMSVTGSSGAIVGVWAPWSGSWVAGLGESSFGGESVSVEMRYRIGPSTRSMTCDVLYQVAEEGTVQLDDSVTKWVTGVSDLKNVTLEQLCDSTSGVGGYASRVTSIWLQNLDREWDPKELVSFGLGDLSDVPPGDAYRASDAGYILLGLALQRATGKSPAVLLRRYVFDRLGMGATALPAPPPAPPAKNKPVLEGWYTHNNAENMPMCTEPQDVTELSSSIGFTDSGVVSTVTDLGTYTRALAAGALVPADAGRFDDLKPISTDSPSWFKYGGGAVHAAQLIGQYGAVPGYLSAAYADPTSGLTIVVVLNNSRAGSALPTFLAWELAALVSKIPATVEGREPVAGLPWTAEQYRQALEDNRLCPEVTPEPQPEPEPEATPEG